MAARRVNPSRIVRPLRSGQITIPADFRKELGIDEDSLLQMTLCQGELHIKPVRVAERGEGSLWLKELYDRFAPAREAAEQYTEDEINADIDQALADVRRKDA
ncbi:MAG TPA: AbrB/MazE/SpoVT family DNA-binding domain-containing protein [Chloroflexota bacterium]|nr:AbrB/MazE/SpoVT family DNA-binding domain-containing protein [Chloroflexota bacterium]